MTGYFDAHIHLTDPRCVEQIDQIMSEQQAAGIGRFLLGGFDSEDWTRQDELKERWPSRIFTCAGIHPWAIARNPSSWGEEQFKILEERVATPTQRPAAIGEVGIDLSHGSLVRARDDQMRVVKLQLELAAKEGLPVVLHCVKGNSKLLEELRKVRDKLPGALVHGFGGDPVFAKELVAMDVVISMGPRSMQKVIPDVLAGIPDHLLAVESDAPLSSAREGQHGCDPRFVVAVAEWLSMERGMDQHELLALCSENIERLLGLAQSKGASEE